MSITYVASNSTDRKWHLSNKLSSLYSLDIGIFLKKALDSLIHYFLRAVLGSQQNEQNMQSPNTSAFHPAPPIASTIVNTLHQSDAFVTTDVPTLTHYHKYLAYIWVHS